MRGINSGCAALLSRGGHGIHFEYLADEEPGTDCVREAA